MGVTYSVNQSFFDQWTAQMAYVLGFFYADGSMYPSVRGKYIVITSTDKPIIFKIKKWLKSKHTIVRNEFLGNRKTRFALRIGNKTLYNSLLRHGLYPNKSLTVRMPIVPREYLKDFVRGYFDGDGCVYLYRSKGIKQKVILRKLSVIFTSGSKKFLEGLLIALRHRLRLKQEKIYVSQRTFQLRFATNDSMEIFKFMYGDTSRDLFFLRKYRVFSRYLALRPQRIDKETEIVLQSLRHGHVAN